MRLHGEPILKRRARTKGCVGDNYVSRNREVLARTREKRLHGKDERRRMRRGVNVDERDPRVNARGNVSSVCEGVRVPGEKKKENANYHVHILHSRSRGRERKILKKYKYTPKKEIYTDRHDFFIKRTILQFVHII